MGSREKDELARHHPVLSSLVIRPTDSGGGGSDYEPGEVRRDPPPYSARYRMRAGSSVSPVRRHRFSPGFKPLGSRGLGSWKEPGRYHPDYSPPYGRGRFPPGRGRGRGPGPFKVDGLPRNNNPNVRPREGDWICSDSSCKNLNFARREHCNNCNRPRYASSPRRGYPRVPPAPLDHMNGGGYRSPSPRGWPAGPPTRHDVRFPPSPPFMRSDRQDYPDPRDRYRFDRGRDNYFKERRGYGRRMDLSPPPAPAVFPPPRGWASASHFRDRSRSPVRVGSQQYLNRIRDNRHGVGRDAF